MLKSTIIAGVLFGIFTVSLIGQNANAQTITAIEQSIQNEKLEISANYEIKDGKVVLDFELVNHYAQTNNFEFSSGQQFEVVITDENGEEVYRYSDGKFFTQALIYKDIKPGQSIKWQDVWDMTNKDGELLTSGKYTAEINILAGIKEEKLDKSQLTTVIEFNLSKLTAKQFMPEGAQFIIPQESEWNDNFVQIDLNNDTTLETIVFYKAPDNVGLLLLEQNENEWNLKDKIECYGYNLEYAGFSDIDGDKRPEVLIGVKGHEQHKQLRVYKLHENKYTPLYKFDYDKFSIGDLDEDGILEIASIIRTNKEIPYVKLQVHGLSDNSYKVEHEMEFVEGSYYDNVVIGTVREGKQGIFVDLGVGAHSGVTEIIIKENGKYKSALPYNKGDELPPTFKPYPLLSKDINNDGIIEVGIQSMPPETDNLPLAAIPWINNWYQWDGEDGLTLVMKEFSTRDYQFVIPQNWYGKYTIDKNLDSSLEFYSVKFVYLAEDNENVKLLALHTIPKKLWHKQGIKLQNPHILLGESEYNDVLIAELPPDNVELSNANLQEYKEMLLDEESIKSHFITAQERETLEKSHEKIMEIEQQFFSMLFRPETVENSNEVMNYQSKEDLINDISRIADRELVTKFVNQYYREEGNKLYIIPQGMPPQILSHSFYEFNQIDKNTYEIIQNEGNVMMGAYRLTVTFTNANNCWRMIDRTVKLKPENNADYIE
jgi:hypothetical protein